MNEVLSEDFFLRQTEIVARDLLGMFLVRRQGAKISKYRILETEAYLGEKDKACHAYKGRTGRTEVMYGPPRHWYVYLVYGMYEMLNIVTREEGVPEAVLIRGVEGYNGPGKLTKALGINRGINTLPAEPDTGLWIEKGEKIGNENVLITPRIGIEYAEEWCKKPLRYLLK